MTPSPPPGPWPPPPRGYAYPPPRPPGVGHAATCLALVLAAVVVHLVISGPLAFVVYIAAFGTIAHTRGRIRAGLSRGRDIVTVALVLALSVIGLDIVVSIVGVS